MADVQLENGFMRIACELGEAMGSAKYTITIQESRVMWWIYRMTYGYNQKTVKITNSDLSKRSGMCRQNVGRAVQGLLEKNMIYRDKSGYIGIQKDYEKWKSDLTKTQICNLERLQFGEIKDKFSKDVRDIFSFWNLKKIRVHGKIKEVMAVAIDDILRDDSKEDILQAIDNYAKIVDDPKYFYTIRYNLNTFLMKAYDDFKDWDIAHNNYLKDKYREEENKIVTGIRYRKASEIKDG